MPLRGVSGTHTISKTGVRNAERCSQDNAPSATESSGASPLAFFEVANERRAAAKIPNWTVTIKPAPISGDKVPAEIEEGPCCLGPRNG